MTPGIGTGPIAVGTSQAEEEQACMFKDWGSKRVPVQAMTAAFQSKHQIILQEVPYLIFDKLRILCKP